MDGAAEAANQFGGVWTEVELSALRSYLVAYNNALKNKPFKRLYIDAFAGCGWCKTSVNGEPVTLEGSAQIALSSEPAFDRFVFIEQHPARCAALTELAAVYSRQNVQVVRGDANAELVELCRRTSWKGLRAVLFLDPFNMAVDWSTVEVVAGTQAIDVWYLFPLAATFRQMAIDSRAIDPTKEAALTRALGTPTWRDALYSPPIIPDLFGAKYETREPGIEAIVSFVTHRLESVFAKVVRPRILYAPNNRGNSRGAPLFALYFAASNTRGAPIACRIAKSILGRDVS